MKKVISNFCILIALSLILSLNSCKNNKNDIEIVVPENYYSSLYFDSIKELENISYLKCTDNSTFAVGSLSSLVCDKIINIYDSTTNSFQSLYLKLNDCSVIDSIYSDDSVLYVGYRDGKSNARAGAFSKLTGEKLYDAFLSDEHYYVYSIFEDSSGKLYFNLVNSSGFNLETVTKIYDKSLESESEIDIEKKMNLSENEKVVKIFSDKKDGFYVLSLDSSDYFSPAVYRVSEKFDVLYCIDDFSDMNGDLKNLCLNSEQNLLVMFKERGTNRYFINEINRENGEVSDRYECEFEDSTILTGNMLNSTGQSSDKFDFYISKADGIYGYIIKTDLSEKIIDDTNEKSNSCVFIENDDIYIYNSFSDSNVYTICKVDESGKVVDNEVFKTDKGYLGYVYIDNNEKLYYTQIIDNNQIAVCDSQNTIFTFAADNNIDKIFDLYIDDGNFHIGYLEYKANSNEFFLNYTVFDKNGKKIYKKTVAVDSSNCGAFFSPSNSIFKMIYTDKKNMITVHSFDYKTGKEKKSENGINADRVHEFYKGDDFFDFYYSGAGAVYGYNEADKKSVEIINWNNSQLFLNPDIICFKSSDSIVCTAFDDNNQSNRICLLKKADKETVERLQNRTVINIIAFNASEDLKIAINQYNNSSVDYKIMLNEEITSSDFDELVIAGKTPDIVIWDNEIDMNEYLRNGLFTDLNSCLAHDKELSSEDILKNIYDSCTNAGEVNYLVLDFTAEVLVGDSNEWISDNITYNDLVNSEKKRIFYNMTCKELLELLVTDSISDFVDFENKDCYFDTEEFADILEFIKDDAVDEKYQILSIEDNEKEDSRFSEDKCFLQNTVLSYSELFILQRKALENITLFGVPSFENMYSHIVPKTYIGISKKSEKIDAAWDFVSFLLSPSYQNSISDEAGGLFPVNKEAFENLKISMCEGNNTDIVDMMFAYLLNKSPEFNQDKNISKIVCEEADLYFNGISNIDDTVKNINNKVKLYLNEIL